MTWSIVARDPASGQVGIAVATCAFAVGARVPFVETGTGTVATQAFTNPFYGPHGLALLRAGVPAKDAVRILAEADEGRGERQFHLLDTAGRSAAHTGSGCVPWSGHNVRDGFSVAGNMLAGAGVVQQTAVASNARPGSRWWSASSRRSGPARRPAATSAAGNRPRC